LSTAGQLGLTGQKTNLVTMETPRSPRGSRGPAEGSPNGNFQGSPTPARGKVTDQIIEALRQDIVTGRLARGDRLPNERELAQHFGVSQPTIREVTRALDVMGLLDVRHGSGAYVRGDSAFVVASALQTLLQIERVTILEALDVRETLSRQSARQAATSRTEADLEALDRHVDKLDHVEQFSNVDTLIDELAGFQIAVSVAAHNPLLSSLEAFLINLLLQIQMKALGKRGVGYWRKRSLSFQENRRAIVEALRDKNPESASAAIEDYLEHQRAVFLEDRELSEMRLSDPKAVRAVADAMSASRAL
jgi:GntR family transcriptional regulator, transcriptional repressor for pyruvate dehydrogenase complex